MRARAPVYRHSSPGSGRAFWYLTKGAALARLQARAAIGTLVRRFPALRLAVGPDALERTPNLFLHGVRRLPVLVGTGS